MGGWARARFQALVRVCVDGGGAPHLSHAGEDGGEVVVLLPRWLLMIMIDKEAIILQRDLTKIISIV